MMVMMDTDLMPGDRRATLALLSLYSGREGWTLLSVERVLFEVSCMRPTRRIE